MNDSSVARLIELIGSARDRIIIVSAFIGSEALSRLLQAGGADVHKTVYVRWRIDDILSQATDHEIFEVARSYGARLMCNHQLHAKAYIADDIAIVGSANATRPGLGLAKRSNIELLTKTSASNPDVSSLLHTLEQQSTRAAPIPQSVLDELHATRAITEAEEKIEQQWLPASHYSDVVNFMEQGEWDSHAAADCIALGIPYGSSAVEIQSIANNCFAFRQISEHMSQTTVGLGVEQLIALLEDLQFHIELPYKQNVMPLIDWVNNCASDMIVIDANTDNPKILPYSRI